jgi:putative metallohydrolase (TIGR04338 family)
MVARLGARQAELYAAEAEAIESLGLSWARLAGAQRYVDGLICSEWFFERWPHFVRCTVERRGSGATWSTSQALDADGPSGCPTEGVLLLAPGCLRQPVVLHELAHLLAPPGVGHGPPFAETLLTLVRHEMGFVAFAELYHALRRRDGFASIREGIDSEAMAGQPG